MSEIERLLNIMEKLRAPDGCPWDREQTHESIRNDLLEETYEVLEAIDDNDDEAFKEELGDLLLQVVFHSQVAKERKAFNFEEVAKRIADKLVDRHPHVFGNTKAENSEQVLAQWNELKKKEKPERTSALDGIPKSLPALMYAQKIQKKAARVGFDWKEMEQVFEKIEEELHELRDAIKQGAHIEEEMGDLFFAVVNLSRHLNIDAEQACRMASNKFSDRFRWVEDAMRADAKPMEKASLEVLDLYWEKAKQALT
jgi:tetrapyrrole methylase family protein/MazG family protein